MTSQSKLLKKLTNMATCKKTLLIGLCCLGLSSLVRTEIHIFGAALKLNTRARPDVVTQDDGENFVWTGKMTPIVLRRSGDRNSLQEVQNVVEEEGAAVEQVVLEEGAAVEQVVLEEGAVLEKKEELVEIEKK